MKQILAYFSWHYKEATFAILKLTDNFLKFFYHLFSVESLAKTLFAPWKREYIKPKALFPLSPYFEALTLNIISRLIGATVRIIFITAGFVFLVPTITLGLFFFFIWLITPGVSLPIYLLSQKSKENPVKRILKKCKKDPVNALSLALKTTEGQFLITRLNLSQGELIEAISEKFRGREKVWQGLLNLEKKTKLSLADLFFFFAKDLPTFNQFLQAKEITPQDVYSVCVWFENWQNQERKKSRFWELENLLSIPGVGRNWAFGYTLNLDRYTTDLTTPLPYSHQLVGREKEIAQIEQILSRSLENNCLIIGEPGVGRHTIVQSFAKMVYKGKTSPILARKRVLEINLSAIIGEEKTIPEAKRKLEQILQEAVEAGNVILVIDNFDKYVTNLDQRHDLTDIFAKIIAGSYIQIIGITTPTFFAKYIYPNQEVIKLFEKIEVFPPSKEEAIKILQNILLSFEKKTGVVATFQAITEIVERADQYVTDIPFPEKAIDLLDEALIFVSQAGKKLLTPKQVHLLLSQKTKIPIGEMVFSEKEKLINLEKLIHQQIINQEKAVEEIASAMRRSRLGIGIKDRPIGSFLFLGPTGVGKTETAKALALCWFGSRDRMIRLDMSEYQTREGVDRLIGDFKSKEPGVLAKSVRENPFSLLLLDEIEKAKGEVLNLFLTILEDGFFTDAFGKQVSCRNLIIIGTSNAGAEFIRQKIKQGITYEELRSDLLENVQRERIFSPEFLNRFDGVIVFKTLTKENLKAIAYLMLKNLNKRLSEKKISVKITDELIDVISTLGFDPTFGARPMRRVIQEKVEDHVAEGLLEGRFKKGQEIEINL